MAPLNKTAQYRGKGRFLTGYTDGGSSDILVGTLAADIFPWIDMNSGSGPPTRKPHFTTLLENRDILVTPPPFSEIMYSAGAQVVVGKLSANQPLLPNELNLANQYIILEPEPLYCEGILGGTLPAASDFDSTYPGVVTIATKTVTYQSQIIKWDRTTPPVTGGIFYIGDPRGLQPAIELSWQASAADVGRALGTLGYILESLSGGPLPDAPIKFRLDSVLAADPDTDYSFLFPLIEMDAFGNDLLTGGSYIIDRDYVNLLISINIVNHDPTLTGHDGDYVLAARLDSGIWVPVRVSCSGI